MAELPRSKSSIIVHNHQHFYATGDSAHGIAESGSTNYVGNQGRENSLNLLGTVYGAIEVSPPSDQLSEPGLQSHPTLPRQLSLPERSRVQASPTQESLEAFAGVSHSWTQATCVQERTITTTSETGSLVGGINEDSDISKEEEEEESSEDDAGLEMAGSSSRHSSVAKSTESTDNNITVDHPSDSPPVHTNYNNSFLRAGRVISITKNEGELSSRTMVVMAKSLESAAQCVSLCPHPGFTRNDYSSPSFTGSHVPVCLQGPGNEAPPIKDPFKAHAIICFDPDNTSAIMRNSVWINCQHIWTVRSSTEFHLEGEVINFKELLQHFVDIQERVYKDVKSSLPA